MTMFFWDFSQIRFADGTRTLPRRQRCRIEGLTGGVDGDEIVLTAESLPNPTTGNGCAANGTTDDRAALNTLCNATANQAGDVVTFKRGTYRVASNLTIPANVTSVFLHGAVVKPDAGVTVTFAGPVEAQPFRIFDCSASNSKVLLPEKRVYAEWFGAKSDSGVTDNVTPIYKAFAALENSHGTLEFAAAAGYYGVSDGVFVDTAGLGAITIQGQGWGTKIKHTVERPQGSPDDRGIFTMGGTIGAPIEHLTVRDIWFSGYSVDDFIQIIRLAFVRNAYFEHVGMSDNAYEGIAPVNTDAALVCVFDRCYAENIGLGFSALVAPYNSNAHKTIIRDCVAINCGLGVEHTGRGAIISGNMFFNCTNRGIMACSTSYKNELVIITDNVITGCPHGIEISDYANSIGKTRIANNVLSFCDVGINVGGAGKGGCEIVNNTLLGGSTDQGAIVLGPGRHTVRDNSITYITGSTTGSIDSGTNELRVPLGTDLTEGMTLTIAGVAGTFKVVTTAFTLSGGGVLFCYLDGNANASVSSAAVSYTSVQWAYGIFAYYDDYHVISGNVFRGLGWTTTAMLLRGLKAEVLGNIFINEGAAPGAEAYVSIGNGAVSILGSHTAVPSDLIYSSNKRSEITCSGDPGALTWKGGDVAWQTGVAAGGSVARHCTTAGTAGTLNGGATTGGITTDTTALVVNSADGLYVGAWITIAGVTGAKRITAINGTAVTIHANANATVAGAAVAYSAPVWKAWANIAA